MGNVIYLRPSDVISDRLVADVVRTAAGSEAWALIFLRAETDAPERVCKEALRRAERNGVITWDSRRRRWNLTEKGEALAEEMRAEWERSRREDIEAEEA